MDKGELNLSYLYLDVLM